MKVYVEEERAVLSLEPGELSLLIFAISHIEEGLSLLEALGEAVPGASARFGNMLNQINDTLEDLPQEEHEAFLRVAKSDLDVTV